MSKLGGLELNEDTYNKLMAGHKLRPEGWFNGSWICYRNGEFKRYRVNTGDLLKGKTLYSVDISRYGSFVRDTNIQIVEQSKSKKLLSVIKHFK